MCSLWLHCGLGCVLPRLLRTGGVGNIYVCEWVFNHKHDDLCLSSHVFKRVVTCGDDVKQRVMMLCRHLSRWRVVPMRDDVASPHFWTGRMWSDCLVDMCVRQGPGTRAGMSRALGVMLWFRIYRDRAIIGDLPRYLGVWRESSLWDSSSVHQHGIGCCSRYVC